MMNANITRHRSGWRILFLKAFAAIAIVFILEQVFGLLSSKAAGAALQPFHNHYFSFHTYYLAAPGLGSDITANPSATLRFVIYFILGYLLYTLVITVLFFVWKRRPAGVNTVLFYVMVASCFLKAFFFPPLISVLDLPKREVRITAYSWLFVADTKHINFARAGLAGYDLYSDYDGYNKEYVVYAGIFLTAKSGMKIKLGEMEAGKMKGSLMDKPAMETFPDGERVAGAVAGMVGKLISDSLPKGK